MPENRTPITVDESDSAPPSAPALEFHQVTAEARSHGKSSHSIQLVGEKRVGGDEHTEQREHGKRRRVDESNEEVSAIVVDDDVDEYEGEEDGDVDDVELVKGDEKEKKQVGAAGGRIHFVEMKQEEEGVKNGKDTEKKTKEGSGTDKISHEPAEKKGEGDGETKVQKEGEGRTGGGKVHEENQVKGIDTNKAEDKREEDAEKKKAVEAGAHSEKEEEPRNEDRDGKTPQTKGGQEENVKQRAAAKADEKGDGDPHPADSEEDEEAPLDLAAMSAFEYEQVAKLTPIQLRRYEQFRRSDLKNGKIKKVLVHLNPILTKASEQYVIAVKGLAKLFVGDVVESALEVKKQLGDKGALQPKHLREAYRRLRRNGAIPTVNDKSKLFS